MKMFLDTRFRGVRSAAFMTSLLHLKVSKLSCFEINISKIHRWPGSICHRQQIIVRGEALVEVVLKRTSWLTRIQKLYSSFRMYTQRAISDILSLRAARFSSFIFSTILQLRWAENRLVVQLSALLHYSVFFLKMVSPDRLCLSTSFIVRLYDSSLP